MNAKKLSVILFFVLLFLLPILTFVLPKKTFSESENRVLTTMPAPTLDNITDKKFMNGFEGYFSDHFVLRDQWIAAKTQVELAAGKKEIGGVFLTKDRMMEDVSKPDQTLVDKNLAAIKTYADRHSSVSVMLAPTSAEIYKDELPPNAPVLDQSAWIASAYEKLGANAHPIDAVSALHKAKNKEIYYRTDHHWTSLGAFTAYQASGDVLGFTPLSASAFEVERASDQFLGTIYSKTLYNGIGKDSIDLYHYQDDNAVSEVVVNAGSKKSSYQSIYFRDFLDKKDKYSVFLGSNQPVVTVKTGNKNGKKLLIFKDSYAHCYAQFLIPHYEEIALVDLRYVSGSYEKYLESSDYDQTLFLYNVSTFTTDNSIQKLALAQ